MQVNEDERWTLHVLFLLFLSSSAVFRKAVPSERIEVKLNLRRRSF